MQLAETLPQHFYRNCRSPMLCATSAFYANAAASSILTDNIFTENVLIAAQAERVESAQHLLFLRRKTALHFRRVE